MISHNETPPEKRQRLLKQGKKGLLHLVFSRTGIVAMLLLLQIGLLLLFLMVGNILRRTIPFFRKCLIPSALLGGGGYAEYVAVKYDMLMPVPKNCSMVEAAAIPEAFATVFGDRFDGMTKEEIIAAAKADSKIKEAIDGKTIIKENGQYLPNRRKINYGKSEKFL